MSFCSLSSSISLKENKTAGVLKSPDRESQVPGLFVRVKSSPVLEALVSALLRLLHQLSLQNQAALRLGVRQRGHVFRLSSG